MGCCGGNKTAGTTYSPPSGATPIRRDLPSMDMVVQNGPDLVWVRYNGARAGGFGVVGQGTKVTYNIDGPGAEFPIYTLDANIFRRAGRGQDFSVGIAPPPPEVTDEQVVEVIEEKVFEVPVPELSEIENLDSVAAGIEESAPPPLAKTAGIQLSEGDLSAVGGVPDIEKAQDAVVVTDELEEQRKVNPLEGLESAKSFQDVLEAERWTIPMLARAEVDDLTPYSGIGETKAKRIIAEAQTLWQPTQF